MRMKRALDLALTVFGAVVWAPVVLTAGLLVLICSGRPIFYRSMRRVSTDGPVRIVKFRTMVRNAAEIANRETVPVAGVRFLNIPADSPLYTGIGRLLEKFAITELPQFVHVITGRMSIVGNRPLPDNVMSCLREEYADAEDRFLTRAGLTGPVQLVGRDEISDADRLMLEGAYCRGCLRSYSVLLDITVLVYTVLIVLGLKKAMDPQGVLDLIDRHTKGAPATVVAPAPQPVFAARRRLPESAVIPAQRSSERLPQPVARVRRVRSVPLSHLAHEAAEHAPVLAPGAQALAD